MITRGASVWVGVLEDSEMHSISIGFSRESANKRALRVLLDQIGMEEEEDVRAILGEAETTMEKLNALRGFYGLSYTCYKDEI